MSSHSWEDYRFIAEATRADAKTEDDLNQMISCILKLDSKADKVWDLHTAY